MSPGNPHTPEGKARDKIDVLLEQAGWVLQWNDELNLYAAKGVAVREFQTDTGPADYLLFVDAKAVGVVEAKPVGHTLSGVVIQTHDYGANLPGHVQTPIRPLPFLYMSTGVVTKFRNNLDPDARTREVFHFHKPETLEEWIEDTPLSEWLAQDGSRAAEPGPRGVPYAEAPSTFRSRLKHMPPVEVGDLWQNKVEALRNLEKSMAENRPRALIQMATGSGKTKLAITAAYRLIKHGGARRVLFLVDRKNLGEQAEDEFKNYVTPDDRRRFPDLYNVQRLTGHTIGASSKVVITTIQRFYSMLKGEQEVDEIEEEGSQFVVAGMGDDAPIPVVYNKAIPPEFFDVIFIDECHRSIYSLWRQVLEYFDAFLVGLTATPAAHTFGFFNQNLVMEYSHETAVADGVNVDFEVYRIRTKISEAGSTIEASPGLQIPIRDRQTREKRWLKPDEDVTYAANDLDRNVVSKGQIRLLLQTYRDKLFTEIFPGRTEVPKTLIFAKDDSHAEDIVGIIREVFGRGDEFAQKITYKTTGRSPKDLIQDFRISFYPRIAVTVDMVATGTDIKPVEVVMFMRSVQSRVLFEQMKGRGVRIINDTDLQQVTSDARSKTHFVIVDCVGITETELSDTHPLERKKGVSFKNLLKHVAEGGADPDMLSSLASRLARLSRQCGPEDRKKIVEVSGGVELSDISHGIVDALDPDAQDHRARSMFEMDGGEELSEKQMLDATSKMLREAVAPLAAKPDFRELLQTLKKQFEQIIDEVSVDTLTEAAFSEEAKLKAKAMVLSFKDFIEENKDEIDALRFFYNQPYKDRLHLKDIKKLAQAIEAPPRAWTPDKLWRAYELLEKDKVRGASGERLLTDIVSLVRYTLNQDEELSPYAAKVGEKFDNWMAQQENTGRNFTEEQQWWLQMIRDHIARSLELEVDDFDYTPFVEKGGFGGARKVFGADLGTLIQELNEVLVG